MKITITAPEDKMTRYMIEVFDSFEDGMTSGHVDAETYWDFGYDFANAPTPEQVVDKVVAEGGEVDSHTFVHAYSMDNLLADQVRNLMILAAKEARK